MVRGRLNLIYLLRKNLAVAALAGLAACAKNDGQLVITVDGTTPAAVTTSKPLLGQWTEANGLYILDLRNAKLGSNSSLSVSAITGDSCSCGVLIQGTESTGTMSVSGCSGTSSQCSSFNQTANYTKSTNQLQICQTSSSCVTLN